MVRTALFILTSVFSFILITSAYAQEAKVIGDFSYWKAHVYKDPEKRICFISSQPREMKPKNVRRGVVVFYISHWPKHKVKNEVSVKIGYPFKLGSQPTAEVGKETFKFIVKSDKAFVETPDQEQKLIAAMKKGKEMVISGVSRRGTVTTDTYSLAGISKALKTLEAKCK